MTTVVDASATVPYLAGVGTAQESAALLDSRLARAAGDLIDVRRSG